MAIASGTNGTCTWSISDAGALTVAPTSGSSGYLLRGYIAFYGEDIPWYDYRKQITSAAFSGTIRIYQQGLGSSVKETGDAAYLFSECSELTSVSGIGSLRGLKSTYHLFASCSKLSALDLSSLDLSAVEDADYMFFRCSILSRVTFGSNTRLPYNHNISVGTYFVPDKKSCRNTSNGIVVTTDRAFSELTAAERAGTWTRGVIASFSATARRTTGGVADEDGESITVNVTYATDASTTTRQLTIYAKEASEASYPSTAAYTGTLTGDSGNVSVTLADMGDAAYDLRVELDDGTNTFIVFPSVQSNIRLVELDRKGHTKLMGRACYPLFVYATAPDEADLPVTPCFVLATDDYGLWYYDGQ